MIGERDALHFEHGRGGRGGAPGRAFLRQGERPQPHALPRLCGQCPELRRRKIAFDPAVLQVEYAVGDPHQEMEPVLCDDHRLSLGLDEAQMLPQLGDRRCIEIGKRLVEQVDVRMHGVDRRKGDLLLFAAGEGEHEEQCREDPDAHKVFHGQSLPGGGWGMHSGFSFAFDERIDFPPAG